MRYIIITIILSGFLSSGCTPEAKYKYLSFLVDGIPPPQEETKEELTGGSGQKPVSQKLRVFIHEPYAEKMCTSCHESSYSNKLLYPREELCYTCHSFDVKAKWVHGPLDSGGCLVCHDPHISQYRYMLVAKSEEFCLYCHDKSFILSFKDHADALRLGCVACHDAHMSDRRFMLKKDVIYIEKPEAGEESPEN